MLTVTLIPTTRARARLKLENFSATALLLDTARLPLFGAPAHPSCFLTDPLFSPVLEPEPLATPAFARTLSLASGATLLSDEVVTTALFEIAPYSSFRLWYSAAHPLHGLHLPPTLLTCEPLVFESD